MLTALPALRQSAARTSWHWQGLAGWQVVHSEGTQLLGRSQLAGRWGGWLKADGITWRSLPADEPKRYVDENGSRRSEDDADWNRRHQETLDRLYASAGLPGSAAVPQAVAWAREAGLNPDPDAVAAALDADGAFVEAVLFRLLAALGVPDAPIWSL